MRATSRLTYLPQLDGVRAIAVLLVVISHLPAIIGFQGSFVAHGIIHAARTGYFGVDIFFVLSGFLITRILIKEFSEISRINFKLFYLKRALRILPIYYVCMLFCFFYLHLGYAELFAAATYTTNIGYLPTNPQPMEHTWSLSVEEQFYLVWPFLLTLVNFRHLVWLTKYALPAVAIMSAVVIAILDPGANGAMLIYKLPCTRMLSLSLGGFLAFREYHHLPMGLTASLGIFAIGIVLSVLAVIGRSHGILPPGAPYWVVALLASSLTSYGIVAAAAFSHASGVISGLLRLKLLRYIGRVSYGLYLYHYVALFVFGINEAKAGETGAPARTVLEMALLTIIVTVMSFHFFELPIMHLKTRLGAGAKPPIVGRVNG